MTDTSAGLTPYLAHDCTGAVDDKTAALLADLRGKLAEMKAGYNLRNDEVTGLMGMLERAWARVREKEAELAAATKDARRYQVRRKEFHLMLGEDPGLYDAETDALAKVQEAESAAIAATQANEGEKS